jgi:hypothetical protein
LVHLLDHDSFGALRVSSKKVKRCREVQHYLRFRAVLFCAVHQFQMKEMFLQRKQIAKKKTNMRDKQGIAKNWTGQFYQIKNYNLNATTYEYFRFKALSDVLSFADCSPDCSTCPDK